MAYTKAYKEHIMYTFNGFCKVVIRYAAINAWRERSRRRQREISFEYLTEEKFYPFSTSDEAPCPAAASRSKPPRQLQPEIIHRLFLQLLCPALPETEMDRRSNQRMLRIVCKAIPVQEICLLPLRKFS